jgi:peptidoglycan hydrolase-like protein with peptidoglycan-binding domain
VSVFIGYTPAGPTCTGGPTPGALALMSWYLGAYKAKGGDNDGIYNCRDQRGSLLPSLHSEGRAADLGVPATNEAWAQQLANKLVAHSKELGIQCVIYNRRIWSGAHPNDGWRYYGGVDPHTSHLHVELSRAAAAKLTTAKIRSVLNPARKPVLSAYLREGSSGAAVRRLQKKIGATVDGRFGPKTEARLKAWQRSHHLTADGVVGPRTARALGWEWRG